MLLSNFYKAVRISSETTTLNTAQANARPTITSKMMCSCSIASILDRTACDQQSELHKHNHRDTRVYRLGFG
eukprot:scaffold6158_cov85-Skeletonema_dohrnii-CCMP3373.AAC.2